MKAATVATTRAQTIVDRLRQMLLKGDFPPGARLPEQLLADKLGVSRTPVHDALAVLRTEELVSYAPNRGYFVNAFEISEVLDAFDVRIVLESMACRVVAERGLPKDAEDEIFSKLEESEILLFTGGWDKAKQERWFQLNLDFHNAILAVAANKPLTRAVELARAVPQLFNTLNGDIKQVRQLYRQAQSQDAFRDHKKIFEALSSGQGERAAYLMREHIFANREASRRNYENAIAAAESTNVG